jgi:hypothetical protein
VRKSGRGGREYRKLCALNAGMLWTPLSRSQRSASRARGPEAALDGCFSVVLKCRNKPQIVDGKWFASIKEANRYVELCWLERAGKITNLKLQMNIPIIVNGHKICTYRADFVYRENGEDIVEDVKSKYTRTLPLYKIKRALLWATQRTIIKET